MARIRRLALLNAITFFIHLIMSWLIQFKAINKKDVGEISDQYPSIFTPSGTTFLIWTVIYLALIAFSVFHLIKAFKEPETNEHNRDISNISSFFIINNIATASWLIFWVNNYIGTSEILILIQLLTLIIIHVRLNIHDSSRSFASKLFTQFPLSIYLGWISIATIANTSVWLTCMEWDRWGVSPINWTITMIALAVFLTLIVINRKKNVFFGLVFIWALYGIITKRTADDAQDYEPIIMVSWIGIAIITLACIFGFIRNLRRR
ncbi:MAG: tryptophan-rich sensory protein [Chitinophagaceae bacterium]|nr:tryptophan-rich sensory protein [Chitinophagaceae bacterium]